MHTIVATKACKLCMLRQYGMRLVLTPAHVHSEEGMQGLQTNCETGLPEYFHVIAYVSYAALD